ncbi:hypothetical protein DY000_02061058 [Brassica cretica]|uniref:PB1 domain-containing protein n=1 Tax=Brassica cretica TaxID=69181 RepID=A0ABQ7ASZ0_BRACR|nr:hypothetical protein DY000_02061058 [Brassica cretica]
MEPRVFTCTNSTGEVEYTGGDVQTIECKLEALFRSLSDEFGDGLHREKVWYKLPFEDHEDRNKLSHCGGADFVRMSESGKWTGVVNVFLTNT